MFVPIKISDKGIFPRDSEIEEHTFKSVGLKEMDIEEYLRKNIKVIFEDDENLLIVGQQVHNSGGGRSDLTALDKDGSLVLIEIKRDIKDVSKRKESLEFQAIRYAASYAKISTPAELVDKIFAKYIERHKSEFELGELTPAEKGRRIINDFLKKNEATASFNKRQRIILIASGFDSQTLAAISWLISNNVDISCFEIKLARYKKQNFLRIEKIMPPEKLEEYYLDIHETSTPSLAVITGANKKLNKPRIPELIQSRLIKPGDRLFITNHPDSEAVIVDENFVKYKHKKIRYNDWGCRITGWSTICIYEWAVHKPTNKKLAELRDEIMLGNAKKLKAA